MEIKRENVVPLYETKFINLYDLQYGEGKHYFDATRHKLEDITAIKNADEHRSMLPDAVSCAVVLDTPEGEYLLLTYEYRYPLGQYLLSVPAGLIDEADKDIGSREQILITAAKREIREETGIEVKDSDIAEVLNPCLFSSPGMTDESNALMYVRISIDDLSVLDQSGAVGSELFDGFELVDRKAAEKILKDGCDKNGIYFSVYTYMALKHFVTM